MWEMVYRKYECKATPLQEKTIDKKEANQR